MSELEPVRLIKMSGAGNTFVLVDARAHSKFVSLELALKKSRVEIVKLFCDRVSGLATDGVLFIEEGIKGVDFKWDFYNSDGSSAEMCGNAARCAAKFCSEFITRGSDFSFLTGAGIVSTKILENGKVQVRMPEAQWLRADLELVTEAASVQKFQLVDTGVPHLVKKVESLSQAEILKPLARESRHHADLKPKGANVTFYSEETKGKVSAITFERGVEDYTLACGTGAVAAAMVYQKEKNISQVQVAMPGGMLEVQFFGDQEPPLMTGEAVIIGEFHYNTEVLK